MLSISLKTKLFILTAKEPERKHILSQSFIRQKHISYSCAIGVSVITGVPSRRAFRTCPAPFDMRRRNNNGVPRPRAAPLAAKGGTPPAGDDAPLASGGPLWLLAAPLWPVMAPL